MSKYIGFFITVLALVFLGLGALNLFETRAFWTQAFSAEAEVIEIQERGDQRYPVLKFVDDDGELHEFAQIPNTTFSKLQLGSTHPIYYDPNNLNDIRLASLPRLWGPGALWLSVGIILLLAGLMLIKRAEDAEKEAVAAALEAPAEDTQDPEIWNESDIPDLAENAEDVPPPPRPRRDRWKPEDAKLLGPLKALIDDPTVTDIIVSDYETVAVKRGDKTKIETDIRFQSPDIYEDYVDRLLFAADSTYSVAKPFADGMLGPFVRLHAVHEILCETGPYLSIRISRFNAITIDQLVGFGMGSADVLAYLKGAIEGGHTLLIGGEVGTGKTTLARALAACIQPSESILVIEDTPEIQIEHPLVRYIRTREANMSGNGKVAVSTCIRGGLRMAMNRIILGEIRDGEAAEAFVDVCTSGHPGLSTIHARSSTDIYGRLELLLSRSQPTATHRVLRSQIATALQVVVFLKVCPVTGRRRIMEVQELQRDGVGAFESRMLYTYGLDGETPHWAFHGFGGDAGA